MATDPNTVWVDSSPVAKSSVRALITETQTAAEAGARVESGALLAAESPDLFGDPLFNAISTNWIQAAPSTAVKTGRKCLAFTSSASWSRRFTRAEFGDATTLSFFATIREKASGGTSPRILIIQYSDAAGAPDNAASEVARQTISVTTSAISTPTTYRASDVAIDGSTAVVVVYVDIKVNGWISDIQLAGGGAGPRNLALGPSGTLAGAVVSPGTLTGAGGIGRAVLSGGTGNVGEAVMATRWTAQTFEVKRGVQMFRPGLITGLACWYQVEGSTTSTGAVERVRDAAGLRPDLIPHASSTVRRGPGWFDFDGTAALVTEMATPAFVSTGWTMVPDYGAGAAGTGFSCTGLDRITTGDYAGCWLVGDHGLPEIGGGGTQEARVHVISPDWRTIMLTIDVAATDTVQGVAWDSSDDTFWFIDAGDFSVRHFGLDGVEITGDIIDWTTEGLTAGGTIKPNSCAYIPADDALIVGGNTGTDYHIFDCDSAASPRKLVTFTGPSASDQLDYQPDQDRLYIASDVGGALNKIQYMEFAGALGPSVFKVQTLQSAVRYARAGEGIEIDHEAGVGYMLNNAGFHTNLDAEPQRNIAITAKLTAPTSRVKSNTLLVGLFAQGRGLLAGGDVLVAGWDPLTDSGWYLAQNNAGWQFYARSYPGETALNMSFAGDASTEHCIVLAVDLGADTVQLWVDGVSLTASVDAGTIAGLTRPLDATRLAVGAQWKVTDGTLDRHAAAHITDVIVGTTVTTGARETVEGVLCWANGQQALLPGGHTYASSAPS